MFATDVRESGMNKMDKFKKKCQNESTIFIKKLIEEKNKKTCQKFGSKVKHKNKLATADHKSHDDDQIIVNKRQKLVALLNYGLIGAISGLKFNTAKLLIKHGANNFDEAINVCINKYWREKKLIRSFFIASFIFLFCKINDLNTETIKLRSSPTDIAPDFRWWWLPNTIIYGLFDRKIKIKCPIKEDKLWKKDWNVSHKCKRKKTEFLLVAFFPRYFIKSIILPCVSF